MQIFDKNMLEYVNTMVEGLKYIASGLFGSIVNLLYNIKMGKVFKTLDIIIHFTVAMGCFYVAFLTASLLHVGDWLKLLIAFGAGLSSNSLSAWVYNNEGELIKRFVNAIMQKLGI